VRTVATRRLLRLPSYLAVTLAVTLAITLRVRSDVALAGWCAVGVDCAARRRVGNGRRCGGRRCEWCGGRRGGGEGGLYASAAAPYSTSLEVARTYAFGEDRSGACSGTAGRAGTVAPTEAPEMRWDGMGWDGMGWDGMGWDGTG
jgi:hypothetical protein